MGSVDSQDCGRVQGGKSGSESESVVWGFQIGWFDHRSRVSNRHPPPPPPPQLKTGWRGRGAQLTTPREEDWEWFRHAISGLGICMSPIPYSPFCHQPSPGRKGGERNVIFFFGGGDLGVYSSASALDRPMLPQATWAKRNPTQVLSLGACLPVVPWGSLVNLRFP